MQAHTNAKGTEKNQHKYNSAIGMPKRKVQKTWLCNRIRRKCTLCRSSRHNDHKPKGRHKNTTISGPAFFDGDNFEKHPWTCTNTTAGAKARKLKCKRQKDQTDIKSNRRKFLERRNYHRTEITTAGDNIAATQRETRNNDKLSKKQSRGKKRKTKKQRNR